MIDEQAILEVLDRLRNRFYGKYRGTVVEVDEDTLRIKAKVPRSSASKPRMVRSCLPMPAGRGVVFLPETGAGVWIEFERAMCPIPIWTGCYWREGEKPDDAKPKVKTIITASQHKIVLDDDGGRITISDANNNMVTLDSSGITLVRGGKVVVSDFKVSVNDGALEVI